MKRTIILMPRAGLGNRMRTISSFIHLKEKVNADLLVLWQPDSGLNAKYHEVFMDNPNFEVIQKPGKFKLLLLKRGLLNHTNPVIRKCSRLYNQLIKGFVKVDGFIEQEEILKGYQFVENKVKKHQTIFVNTSSEIIDYPEGLQTFKPSQQVTNRLKETLGNFGDSTIGFHIRRTDHRIAIANSPVELFEKKINHCLTTSKNIKFFLATDDPEVEKELKSKFKSNCIIHEKVFGRNSKAGIIDAAAEMYLLSKTKKIYGSYWSSFSIISAKISGIDYEILKLPELEKIN